jgi:predicted molibdopterin-dependent oxidoreductase YjgC
MGIMQRHNGTELLLTLANLAMLCGQIGKPSTVVNPLRGQSNVQGASDMGALPISYGTMTWRSEGLTWGESRGYAAMHEQDAAAAGIRDGGPVLITSRGGQVRT